MVVVVMMVIVVVMVVIVVTLTVTPPGPLDGAGHGGTNHVPLNLGGGWEASSDEVQEL